MLTRKFLLTLLAIILGIIVLCKSNFGSVPIVEGWWNNLSFKPRAMPVSIDKNGTESALPVTVLNQDTMGSSKFFQVANFDAMLSPRFSNVSLGANIRYNTPDRKNLASPCDPLTFRDLPQNGNSQENFQKPNHGICGAQNKEKYCGAACGTGGCGTGPVCGKGGYGMGHGVDCGYELPSGYANGNFYDEYNSLPGQGSNMGDGLPLGTMTTMDGAGNIEQ